MNYQVWMRCPLDFGHLIKFKRSKHIMQTVLLLSALAWASDWGISSYDVSMYSRMHQLHLQIFRVSSCLSVLLATRTVQNFQLWRLQSWSSRTCGIIKVDMLQLHTLQGTINWARLGDEVWVPARGTSRVAELEQLHIFMSQLHAKIHAILASTWLEELLWPFVKFNLSAYGIVSVSSSGQLLLW